MSKVVPDGWEVKRLGEVSKVFFSNVDKKSHPDEIPVFLCNYMDVYNNSYIRNGLEFMPATAKQREIDKFLVKQGDVIITKDSETPDDIAVSTYVSEDLDNVLCGYHLALIRADNRKLYGGFLSHLFGLDAIQHHYYQLANGSTRFGLTSDVILDSRISIPPLPEQQKIASILSSVDEVIENTQSQINKLQDLKKGTMNELLTRGIGHTEFKDSPVGRIPVGWEVQSLDEISRFRRGSFPQPYGRPEWYSENGHPFVQVFDISDNNGLKPSTKVRISDAAAAQSVFMPKGSLIVSLQGSIGRTAITQYDAYVDRTILIFSNYQDKLEVNFFSTTIKELFRKKKEVADGGIIKTITKETLRDFKVSIPSLEEQRNISKILGAIQSSIDNTYRKLESTRSLKKSLMQDLLIGKVRVTVH